MQTTVFARGRILPRAHVKALCELLLVERSDQKVLDLGLAIFERTHSGVGVIHLADQYVDFRFDRAESSAVVSQGVRDLTLVGAESVDGGEHGPIVGLSGLKSGDPCLEIFQRSHGCIVSGGTETGSRQCGSPAVGRSGVEGGL